MRINKCRHNVVFIIWFSRIHIHSGDFIITFWLFVISHNSWVKVFRCPSTKICVHTRAGSWMCPTSFRCPSTLGWISTWSWPAFTVWGFLIPLGRFHEALSSCVQIPPPHRWPSGPMGHIHSLWHIHYGNILLCDTYILSKCNWQIICDTLQIDNLLNLQFRLICTRT